MKLTTDHYDRIKTFMKLAGQETPEEPITPSLEIRKLRAKLILEEALETIYALGFEIEQQDNHKFWMNEVTHFNQIEVVDGCCDISVVTIGTLIACGVPDDIFLREVDQNNIEKIQNSTIRDDGKLVKDPDHKPPKIQEILEKISKNEII